MSDIIKFIQASDFHLDQPLRDLPELPTHLKSTIANAPYTAAKKIFDLAITEKVDFVLLAGDLLDVDAGGCRPAAFLLSHFERLAEKGIAVYWCGGEDDHPERWPAAVELPDNVTIFSSTIVEEVTHQRKGRPVATILGSGFDPRRKNGGDFIVEQSAVCPIAITYGAFEPQNLVAKNIRYWALGGNHRGSAQEKNGVWIVSSGTPQCRGKKEIGAHGCQLVKTDTQGLFHTQLIETDSVRWLPQKLAIAESASIEELKNVLTERALKIISDHPESAVLVHWQLATSGNFNPLLRQPRVRQELLDWLRHEFGRSELGLWSVDFVIDPPHSLPGGWYEEDTILGDYLRAIGRYQSDPTLNLALHEYLPDSVDNDAVANVVRLTGESRQKVLTRATMLGVEYLAAHRDVSEAASSSAS